MKKENLFSKLPNGKLVVGVSGGSDSVLLLTKLLENGYRNQVIVAHVNHGLREESYEEYTYVKELCDSYGIYLDYVEFNLSPTASEQEARNLRYSFYKEILTKYNTKNLVLGHHADDLIEGVYMRFTTGSFYRGLIHLSFENHLDGMVVYRPLLNYTKNEIYKECKDKSLKWYEDITNKSDLYTRNRYRNNIVPLLKQENPNLHSTILKFSEIKSEEEDYFDFVVKEQYESLIQINKNILKMDKDGFNKLQKPIQRRLLKKVFNELGKEYVDNDIYDKYIEKTSNPLNTDYNLVYKGYYLVQSQKTIYFLNEQTKIDLLSNNLIDTFDSRIKKDINKKMKVSKLPLAFRNLLYTNGDCIVDINNNKLL